MQVKHIGMGVVIIENLFEIDKNLLLDYINWLKKSPENTFEYFVEDGEKYARNQTGFIFKYKDIEFAPQRFLDTRGKNRPDKDDGKFNTLVDLLEDSAYKGLVEYCKIFPDAATTSWWRPVGHVAGYKEGQRIGPHCDDQVPYVWGEETGNQVSMHNSVSINLYLNDCTNEEIKNPILEYNGGELNFPNVPFQWMPKSGSAAIYPSNYIGRHEVLPVLSGERYAFLTMACYGTSFDNKEKVGEPNEYKIWMKDLISDITSF